MLARIIENVGSAVWGRSSERDLILQSGLFDENWYNERFPAAPDQSADAIDRYLAGGAAKGHRPHPLFDVDWYVRTNPDAALRGLSPLGHYIKEGKRRGASPHPLFDPKWYREQVPHLGNNEDPFHHFVSVGATQGLTPHALFDVRHYFAAHPQLIAEKVNPLTHYVEIGASQGYAPNGYFDGRWYAREYPEVLKSGENPLAHFVCQGASKGYRPHPQVDVELFMADHPDTPRDPLAAYIELVRSGGAFNATALDTSQTAAVRDLKAELSRSMIRRPAGWLGAPRDLTSFASFVSAEDMLPKPGGGASAAPILKAMNGAAVVSFDVWDTMLRRDCHPDEIKLQAARFLIIHSFIHLRPAYWDIVALFRARLDAESKSSANNADFKLRDAINLWLAQVLKPESYAFQIKPLMERLVAHELQAEKRCLRADQTIAELLPSVTSTKTFATDHYFSIDQMRELLDEVGFSKFFPTGYVSSDRGTTKREGGLYDNILYDFSIPGNQLVHIGDRQIADVEVPSLRGIRALHYASPSEERRQSWFAEAFDARLAGDLTPHTRRILMLLEGLAKEYEINLADDLRAIGVRLSPIFVSFIFRIIVDAVGRKVDRVYFFRREGIFLKELYEAVRTADPFNIEAPEAELLDVSRTATFVASIAKLTPQELMRMWHQYDTQSFSALAASLNLDETIAANAAANCDLDFSDPIRRPWQDRRFCAALSDPALRRHAESRFAEQKTLLLAYLRDKGFIDEAATPKLVVDIGWRGTIQDSLCRLTDSPVAGHYLALFKYLTPQQETATKFGWLGNENNGDALRIEDVAVLEAICAGAGGTVVGYQSHIDGVQPILASTDGEEESISRHFAHIQEGILATVLPLCDYVRAHGLTPEDLLNLARGLASVLVYNPPQGIADAFFSFRHNEMFGNGQIYDFTTDDLLTAVDADQETSAMHARAEQALSAVRWPTGVAHTSKMAHWYRSAPPEKQFALPTSFFQAQLGLPGNIVGAKLVVYSPPPLAASGGHRTLFRIVRQLARLGFDTHVMVESVGDGLHILEEYLEYQPVTFHTEWAETSCDLALASIARSAHYVAGLTDARHRAYLVQDYEALFDAMGDGYITGENSYARGLHHLTIGNWLTHVVGAQFGLPGAPAGLGVDTRLYRPDSDVTHEFAVCALYQPEKSRRTPLFVAEALRILGRRFPKLKIYAFGSSHALQGDGNIENLGSIGDLNELNKLYNRCIAGFCPSTSNPSRIPYEMMAAGCVPVDLYRYNNLLDYREGSALLAYQTPASVAAALELLLTDEAEASRRRDACIQFASSRSESWETDVICNHILAMMAGRELTLGEVGLPAAYADAPLISQTEDTEAVRRFCAWQKRLADNPLREFGGRQLQLLSLPRI